MEKREEGKKKTSRTTSKFERYNMKEGEREKRTGGKSQYASKSNKHRE